MEDLLISNLEDEAAAVPHGSSSSKSPEAKNYRKLSKNKKVKSPSRSDAKNGEMPQPETSAASELCTETIVTMYTSDILSNEARSYTGKQTSSGLYFSGASEVESNIKCVLTTFLFLGVVAAIIIVAIFKNPGM